MKWRPLLCAVLCWSVILISHARAIDYVYDNTGRVVAATDDAGNVARYRYDPAGNVLGIERTLTTQLAIVSLTPSRLRVGETLRIVGFGFSTAIGGNTVRFSGVEANVQSFSATELVVTAPASAVTGPISVTTSLGTVSSVDTVEITTAPRMTFAAVGNDLAVIGQSFFLTGQGLGGSPADYKINFGSASVTPTAVTETTITLTVPEGANSGQLEVSRGAETALTTEVYVAPAALGVSSLSARGRLVRDGAAASVSIPAAGWGAFTFDLTSVDDLSQLLADNFSPYGAGAVTMISPSGRVTSLLLIENQNNSNSLINLAFDAVGRYTVFIKSNFAYNGQVKYRTAQFAASLAINGGIARLDNPSGGVINTSFVATANSSQSLILQRVIDYGGNSPVNVRVNRPDGSVLVAYTVNLRDVSAIVFPAIVTAGTYALRIERVGGANISVLADLRANAFTAAATSEQAIPLALQSGQSAVTSFPAVAGKRYALALRDVPSDQAGFIYFRRADWSLLADCIYDTITQGGRNVVCESEPWPSAETAYVEITPYEQRSLTASAFLSGELLRGPLTIPGTVDASNTLEGQRVRFSINATAGERLNFYQVGSAYANINVTQGTTSRLLNGQDSQFEVTTTGLHTVTVEASNASRLNAGTQLIVSREIIGTIPTGTPASYSTNTAGQTIRLSFTGVQGDVASINLSSLSITGSSAVIVSIIDPSNRVIRATQIAPPAATITIPALPETGTYQVLIDPFVTSTVSVSASRGTNTSLSANTVSDSPLSLALGQGVVVSVPVTTGQSLGFALTGITTGLSAGTDLSFGLFLLAANGSSTNAGSCSAVAGGAAACSVLLPRAALDETMRLLVVPQFSSIVTATLSMTAPISRAQSLNTAGAAITTTRPGQPVSLTFTSLAGKRHWLGARDLNRVGMQSVIYRVQGSVAQRIVSGSAAQATGSISTFTEGAAAQTYEVVLAPPSGAPNMTVSPDLYTPLELTLASAVPQPISTLFADRTVELALDIAAGQGFNLTTTVSQSPGAGISYWVGYEGRLIDAECGHWLYAPDGRQLSGPNLGVRFSQPCNNLVSTAGQEIAPVSGRYRFVIRPPVQQWLSGSARFLTNQIDDLVLNTPKSVTTGTAGQVSVLRFNATAGQDYALRVSGVSQPATLRLSAPSGANAGFSSGSGNEYGISLIRAAETGTYTARVSPTGDTTLAYSALLTPATTTVLTMDGAPSTVTTASNGQIVRLDVDATVGQTVTVALTSTAFTPAATLTSDQITVMQPSGTRFINPRIDLSSSNGHVRLERVPETGRYSIYIAPPLPARTFSLTALASSELVAPLALGTSYSLSITRPARTVRLNFEASAGQTLSVIAANTVLSSGGELNVSLRNSSDQQLAWTTWGNGSNTFALPTFTVSGTYSVVIQPRTLTTATATLSLSAPATLEAAVDGIPIAVSNAAPGQVINVIVPVTGGQSIGFGLTGVTSTVAASDSLALTLFTSNNVAVASTNISGGTLALGGGGLEARNLTIGGNYRLQIVPPAGVTVSTGTLTVSSELNLGTVPLNSALDIAALRPGQGVRLTFAGTSAQRFDIHYKPRGASTLSGLSTTVLRPGGGWNYPNMISQSDGRWWYTLNPFVPTLNGDHTLVLYPRAGSTRLDGALTVSTELQAPIALSTTQALDLIPGRRASFTFSGTAGQRLGLAALGLARTDAVQQVDLTLLDGATSVANINAVDGDASWNLPPLPRTGTYTLAIAMGGNRGVTGTLVLTPNVIVPFDMNNLNAFATTLPGQNVSFSISGGVSNPFVSITNFVSSNYAQSTTVRLFDSSGAEVGTFQPGEGSTFSSSTFNYSSGTAIIDPDGTATVSGALGLGNPPRARLVPGGAAVRVAGTRPNTTTSEFFRKDSNGLMLRISDVVVNGGSDAATMTVWNPNGSSEVWNRPLANGLVFLPYNSTFGNYKLEISPAAGTTFNAMVRLESGTPLYSPIGATPETFTTTAGQPALNARIDGSAYAQLSIALDNLSPTPSEASPLQIAVYGENGNLLASRAVTTVNDAVLEVTAPGDGSAMQVIATRPSGTFSGRISVSKDAGVNWYAQQQNDLSLVPGQRLVFRFDVAFENRNYGFGFAGVTLNGASSVPARVMLNGQQVATVNLTAGDQSVNVTFPTNGNAELIIDPPGIATLSAQVAVTPDQVVTLSANSTQSVASYLIGSNLRLRFSGYPDVVAALTDVVVSGSGSGTLTLSPEGGAPESTRALTTGQNSVYTLRDRNGTFELFIDPPGVSTVAFSFARSEPLGVGTGWNFPNQGGASFATSQPAQEVRYNITMVAGAQYQLCVSDLALTSATGATTLRVLASGNRTQLYTQALNAGTTPCIALPAAPTTEVYWIYLTPPGVGRLAGNLEWRYVQATTVPSNGDLTPLSVQQHQILRAAFGATAGESLRLELRNQDGGSNFNLQPELRSPSGVKVSGLLYVDGNTNTLYLQTPRLTETGQYTFVLDPTANEARAVNVRLRRQVLAALALNGASSTVTTSAAVTEGRMVFTASAEQDLGLAITAVSPAPSAANPFLLEAYQGEGVNPVATANITSVNGGALALTGLQAGEYRIIARPTTPSTTFVATLSSDATSTQTLPGTNVVSSTRPGQNLRTTFSGTAGQPVGLAFTSLTLSGDTGATGARLLAPDGTQVTQITLTPGTSTSLNATLTQSGVYSIVIDPPGVATASVSVSASSDLSGTLTAGTNRAFSTTTPGQNVRYTFEGSAGGNMGLAVTAPAITGSSANGTVRVLRPDGSTHATQTLVNGSPFALNFPNLPATGTYTVFIDPPDVSTVSGGVALSSDGTGVLAKPGVTALTTTVAGQNLRYTFAGTVNEFVSFEFADTTITGASGNATTRVLRANGTQVTTVNLIAGTPASFALKLPATETYTLEIDPPSVATISTSVAFSSDLGAALTANTASTATTATPGQNVRYTFSGSSGGNLGLAVTGVAITGSALAGTVSVLKPDDTVLQTQALTSGASNVFNLTNLPAGGTYKVFIDPPVGATLSANLLVSSEITGTANINAAPSVVTTTLVGQNARYALNGTAGEVYQLRLTGTTFTGASGSGTVTVLKPDNTNLVSQTFDAGITKAITLPAMPTTGTYRIFLDPPTTATLGTNLQVRYEKTGALPTNGTATAVTTATLQNARYTFSGTAGQNLGLGFTAVSVTGATSSNAITVFRPNGSSFVTGSVANGATTALNLSNLPETGTYEVFIDPPTVATAGFTMHLTQDKTGTLMKNGAASAVTTTRAGENLRLALAGIAGEAYNLRLTGIALTGATGNGNITVLKPDGSTLTTTTFSNAVDKTVAIAALSETGAYTVLIDPPSSATVSLSVQWLYETTGTLALTGVTSNLALGVAQNARYTFTVTTAGSYGLGIGAVTLTGATTATKVTVLRADGSQVTTVNVAAGSAGSLNLPDLAAGAYSVIVDPPDAASATSSLTLSPDRIGTITISGATVAISTQFAGQNGRYTFSGTAAQLLRVTLTAVTITGGTGSASVTVLNPDGSTLSTKTFTANTTLDVAALPTTGTYTLLIDPPTIATISLSAGLGPR